MKTFTGKEYLVIDIMNNFGYDKVSFEERLALFKEKLAITKDSLTEELYELALHAKEPELAFAGLIAYRDFLNKIPSGYLISFDATASGIQIMSAITADPYGMYGTNLLPLEERQDIYTFLYNEMKNINPYITREQVKKTIMIMMYGGTTSAAKHLGSMKSFTALQNICRRTIPYVYSLMESLMSLQQLEAEEFEWYAPDHFKCKVTLHSLVREHISLNNQQFSIKYKEKMYDPYFKGYAANFIHSLDAFLMREVIGRCNYHLPSLEKTVNNLQRVLKDKKGVVKDVDEDLQELIEHQLKTNMITVRTFDFIRKYEHCIQIRDNTSKEFIERLIALGQKMLEHKPFTLICVHDCFKCLPNNMNIVRRTYNEVLYELVSTDAVRVALTEYSKGKITEYFEHEEEGAKEFILKANYSIC